MALLFSVSELSLNHYVVLIIAAAITAASSFVTREEEHDKQTNAARSQTCAIISNPVHCCCGE
jgi:hypothetical protein